MNIYCMGDSITYGYGLEDLSQRWTDLVARRTGHKVVNCGVNGDMTTGMLARCQTEVFNQDADLMVFLGGINDISVIGEYRPIRTNVISIVRQAEARGLKILLGIPLPICPEDRVAPAWQPERDFDRIMEECGEYADWIRRFAASYQIPTVDLRTPFLLPDGQGNRALFQDGLHPTAEGNRLIADAMCKALEELF